MYRICDIIISKCISNTFLRSDQTKNRLRVSFFLDFCLANDTVYHFFLRLCYRNVNNTLLRAFKPVIILAIPYFTDFFSDEYIVPFKQDSVESKTASCILTSKYVGSFMFCRLQYVRSECFCYLNLLKQKLQLCIFLQTSKQTGYNRAYFFPFRVSAYQWNLFSCC